VFFANLTPYSYDEQGREPQKHVLNVGWLSYEYPYACGDVPVAVTRTLRRLISSPVFIPLIISLGFHGCELCHSVRADEPAGASLLGNPAPPSNVPAPLVNGERWVSGTNNVVYVAPVLVVHYIEVHRYLPPHEFIEAVLAYDDAIGA